MRSSNARSFLRGAATAICTMVVIMLMHSSSFAGVNADVRAGLYPDADAVAIGGGVLAPIGARSNWYFNPNVEVAMGDRRDIVAMSGDFHYDLGRARTTTYWVGGGPAVLVTTPSGGDRRTDFGMNVLTGIGARHGQVRPFGQLRGTVADNSMVTVAGGVRF